MMFGVVCLCSLALLQPWWTDFKDEPGMKSAVEVGLWNRYTRVELAADDSTLNCEKQCDFTKLGTAKVRESEVPWADVCREATDDMATKCQKLWVVRVFVLFGWFMALLYAAFSFLNFCGAGLPSSFRIPNGTKILLAGACVLCCLFALIVAAIMEVTVQPAMPGVEPKRESAAVPVVGLNGIGFLCMATSLIFSLIGVGCGYLAQHVLDHLAAVADVERGRPLADVNRGKPPCLDHQVGVHGGDEREAVKQARHEPKAHMLGNWMYHD